MTGIGMKGSVRAVNPARNATDGRGRLSLVSVPGACTSAQVEMGQMEGCVFACGGGERHTHVRTRTDFLEEEAVGSRAQKLCQRHTAHAL